MKYELGSYITNKSNFNPLVRKHNAYVVFEHGVRDAVEAALSDVILLGPEEQVRLAERAVRALVAGRLVRTDELVVLLRNFIREALDIGAIPPDLATPLKAPRDRPIGRAWQRRRQSGWLRPQR